MDPLRFAVQSLLFYSLPARRVTGREYIGNKGITLSLLLRESLIEWTDCDLSAFYLAVSLGLMQSDLQLLQTRAKHVFWSNNPIGDLLYTILDQLVVVGILEFRDEPDYQYRWNRSFRGTWEPAA